MNIEAILTRSPVIPVLTIEQLEHALPLARALYAGGLQVLEITLRTPIAADAIRCVRDALPDAIVGAGTLLREDDFVAAEVAGAQFGVSPGLSPHLVQLAQRAPFPLLPGVATASELMIAREAGFTRFKCFPAEAVGGVPLLKSFAAPFPDAVFCPTGGITRESASTYLALPNVACVGGSWMAPAALLRTGDWVGIEKLARDAAALRTQG
ncbi:MAG: bifunctional 4-hydroxy-2-oxoglutarate aldolase/2-dehydro-3-deoxy-phosphogluconate aldolase [Steroidobacteraceae bacterium]